MGGIVDTITGKSSRDASKASRQASQAQLAAQQEALDYYKEQQKLPTEMRDKALGMYGGILGLPGFDAPGGYEAPVYDPNQQQLLEKAQASPLYAAQMANIGEMTQGAMDRSLATASATGGLRGGNLQRGFGEISEQEKLAQNQALTQAYQQQQGLYDVGFDVGRQNYMTQLAGLQGMAQMPTGASNIANMMGNIGQTQAQGITGAYQSGQAAQQAGFGNLMGLGQLGLGVAGLF